MKLPRNVSGAALVSAFERVGYSLIRQRGSHMRMHHPGPPRHLITVPGHRPMRVGTLHALITEVAQMRGLSVDEIIALL